MRLVFGISLIFLFSGLLCGPFASGLKAANEREIDAYILKAMVDLKMPAVGLAVVEQGEISFAKGYGSNLGIGVSKDTPFKIASITKSFTSLIVLQLAAEGRLRLDDVVTTYIPQWEGMAGAKTMTVRHLMNHQSGFSTLDGNVRAAYNDDSDLALVRSMDLLSSASLIAKPGEKFEYSNANYRALGYIIEQLDKKTFEQSVKARIFEPLGMGNSFLRAPSAEMEKPVKGHVLWLSTPQQNTGTYNPRAGEPAGGISASAYDMALYVRALLTKDPKIVPPSLVKSWQNAEPFTYEFGWFHLLIDDQRVIIHDGFLPGFRVIAVMLPDANKGAIALTNVAGLLDGNLHNSAARMALGLSSLDYNPSKVMQIMIYASFAGVLLFAFGYYSVMRKLWRTRNEPLTVRPFVRNMMLSLPPLALGFLCFAMLQMVPHSMGLDMNGILVFFPDLGAILCGTALIAALWALSMPILIAKKPLGFHALSR